MKLIKKYVIITVTLFLLNYSCINAMHPELTKDVRYRTMDRITASTTRINIKDCKEIKTLKFGTVNDQLIITALYVKKDQSEEIGHEEGILATWNSNLKLLDTKEAVIVSREVLQPGYYKKTDAQKKNAPNIQSPVTDNQWISAREKDGRWAVYMKKPFTRICFLSNNCKSNPEMAVYSPDGNHIATAHNDTITLWNLVYKNRLMATFEHPQIWQVLVFNQIIARQFIKQQDKMWLRDQFKIYIKTKHDADKRTAKHQLIDSSSRFVRQPQKTIQHYTDPGFAYSRSSDLESYAGQVEMENPL